MTSVLIIDLSYTFGSVLIGCCLAFAFWGVHCIQTVYYFVNYPGDGKFVKIWVVSFWCLDTAHQFVTAKALWKLLIKNYGDYIGLVRITPELLYQTLLTTFVAFMAQWYFMWRIYAFDSRPLVKWSILALLTPLVIWQLVGTIIYTARGLALESTTQLGLLTKFVIGVNSSTAAVDLIIALTMCILLYKSRNGIAATDRLLSSLMISSFNTGAWTALFAISTICLFVSHPNELLYAMSYLPLCSLYCNSILGNLVSRKFMRRIGQQSTTQTNDIPVYAVNAGPSDQSAEKGEVGLKPSPVHTVDFQT